MKSLLITKGKKEEVYSSKKNQRLTLDKNIEKSNSKITKNEKNVKNNNLSINENNRKKPVIAIQKGVNKNIKQSLELELSNIKKNFLALINSNNKNDKNKFQYTIHNYCSNKDFNLDSLVIHNYSTKVFEKGKTINEDKNKLNKNKTKNNITLNNGYIYAQKIRTKKTNHKNKEMFNNKVNSKKIIKTIFKTPDINKRKNKTNYINKDNEENFNKTNISKKINNKNTSKIPKPNVNLNPKIHTFKSSLSSDRATYHISNQKQYKRYRKKTPNNILINNIYHQSKTNNNNSKDDYLRQSYTSKYETNSLNTSSCYRNNRSFSQKSNNKIRKNKYKPFDNRQLIYKTELNLNSENNKEIYETEKNSIIKKRDSSESKKANKCRYLSPIYVHTVHKKNFCFKKNEIIDIKNKNNYIFITKKQCNKTKKKDLCDCSYIKGNYNYECKEKLYEDTIDNNFDLNTKKLIMIFDKMKQVNVMIKPRKNLELKLFTHTKRSSLI